MVRLNKATAIFLVVAALLSCVCFSSSAAPPPVSCEYVYLFDTTTGSVLYEKNSDSQVSPGGLVKLITAIVVIENSDMNDVVTVSANASDPESTSRNNNRVKAGENITVHDLLYMMLLSSSNEAAIALAEHTGGSVDEFVTMMNKLVREIGTENTRLANPTGFDDQNQYTTAKDYAKIVEYAHKNNTLLEIVTTNYIKLSATDLTPDGRHVYNENHLISQLLQNDTYYCSDAQGMAFGYTSNAGYCLASSAQSKKTKLSIVVVVMGGFKKNDDDLIPSFVDAKNLLEWGLSAYEVKTVINSGDIVGEADVKYGKSKDYVAAAVKDDITIMLPVDTPDENIVLDVKFNEDICAPVAEGDVIGTLSVNCDGITYATSQVYASQSVERSGFLYTMDKVSSFFKQTAVKVILGIVFACVAFYIVLTIVANARRRKRLRNYRNRRMNRRM